MSVLPPSLPPRGLSREQAAEYIGIGTTLFDRMVEDGRMPRPRRLDGRTAWDVRDLDRAFEALPYDSGKAADNPWDKICGLAR
ncbi:AlpA family transcriptional regulator [Azospirillum sp. B4]|uniref:helix-turn-helix transcriptional regulator n=1 Tax=Azospirillum sp. B4 TaxID=95605 RepID=UPI00034D0299|nr:hypothetical protein [Azospirillum sp. B4]